MCTASQIVYQIMELPGKRATNVKTLGFLLPWRGGPMCLGRGWLQHYLGERDPKKGPIPAPRAS